MKKTLTQYDFCSEMATSENGFTWNGAAALFDWFEECESSEDEIEFDAVAIRCEYTEYESLEEFQADYGDEYESIEDIEYHTIVIPIDDDAFIIQVF